MQFAMKEQVVRMIPHVVPTNNGKPVQAPEEMKEIQTNAQEISGGDGSATPTKKKEGEVGRNDLCPCGSGKKYKKCHGAGK